MCVPMGVYLVWSIIWSAGGRGAHMDWWLFDHIGATFMFNTSLADLFIRMQNVYAAHVYTYT